MLGLVCGPIGLGYDWSALCTNRLLKSMLKRREKLKRAEEKTVHVVVVVTGEKDVKD